MKDKLGQRIKCYTSRSLIDMLSQIKFLIKKSEIVETMKMEMKDMKRVSGSLFLHGLIINKFANKSGANYKRYCT